MITASCGHTVTNFSNLHEAAIAAYDGKNERCIYYVVYCAKCYYLAKASGLVIETLEQEKDWFDQKPVN